MALDKDDQKELRRAEEEAIRSQFPQLSIDQDIIGQPIGTASAESPQSVVPGSVHNALLQGSAESRARIAKEQQEQAAAIAAGTAPDTSNEVAANGNVSALGALNPLPTQADVDAQLAAVGAAGAEPTAANVTPASSDIKRTREGDIILRRGMGTDEPEEVQAAVKKWQEELKEKGLYNGPIDGIFGKDTDIATREFQNRYRIASDGVVGGQTHRTHREHDGQLLPAVAEPETPKLTLDEIIRLPKPLTQEVAAEQAAAIAAAGFTAEQVEAYRQSVSQGTAAPTPSITNTPEQRAAAVEELQNTINAEFERQNHTVDANGTHHYSFSYILGAPELPKIYADELKNNPDLKIPIMVDGTVKQVPAYLPDGTLNPELKTALTERALDGRLDAAAEAIEEAQAKAAKQQTTQQPQADEKTLDAAAIGHRGARRELLTRIEDKYDTVKGMEGIQIPNEIRAALTSHGVYEYGKGQSVDFRVDPNASPQQQAQRLEAEMNELTGIVSGGKSVDFSDEGIQKAAATLVKPVTAQGR